MRRALERVLVPLVVLAAALLRLPAEATLAVLASVRTAVARSTNVAAIIITNKPRPIGELHPHTSMRLSLYPPLLTLYLKDSVREANLQYLKV